MMRFGEFIKLVEMARVAESDKIYLDDVDMEYLKQFPKEGWSSALQYRYSPAVLLHPEPEVRDVPYTVPYKKEGKSVAQMDKTASQVKVYARELIDKLEGKGYDVSKFELGRNAANTMIKKVLEGKKADFNPPKEFKSGAEEKRKIEPAQVYSDFVRTTREKIELDDNDRKYLAYFDKDPRLSRYKTQAMQMRYSDYFLTHPEAKDVMDITFRTAGGGSVVAQNVPVGVNQLKKKIADLKASGVEDFTRYGAPGNTQGKPTFPVIAAKRWMTQGWYRPGHREEKFKPSGEQIQVSDKLNDFIRRQEEYLDGRGASPNIPDEKDKKRDRQKSWVEILRDDSNIAANMAIHARAKYSDKPKEEFLQFLQSNKDEIAGEIFDYLTDKETVSNMGVRYGSEEARKLRGRTFGNDYIKKSLEPAFNRPKEEPGEKSQDPYAGASFQAWKDKQRAGEEERGWQPEDPDAIMRNYLTMVRGAEKIVGKEGMPELINKINAVIKAVTDKQSGQPPTELQIHKIVDDELRKYKILKMRQTQPEPTVQSPAQYYSYGGVGESVRRQPFAEWLQRRTFCI